MVSRFPVASPSLAWAAAWCRASPMNLGAMAVDGRQYDPLRSPVTLKMTEDAAEAYRQWGLEVENRLRPEGDLHATWREDRRQAARATPRTRAAVHPGGRPGPHGTPRPRPAHARRDRDRKLISPPT